MKTKILSLCLVAIAFSVVGFSQKALLKKTTIKTEKMTFGAGGSLSVVGAPNGSISVESWRKNEIEITAETIIEAPSEADLELLSKVNGYILQDNVNSIKIISVGMHDKDYMKKTAKKFPKALLNMPWRINYTIKVPPICDVTIDGGKGDLMVSGIEGAMQLKAFETNATLNLTGGSINATFGTGTVNVNIGSRSWRGRNAEIQLVTGTMNVKFPQNSNAQIAAKVLRTGNVQNSMMNLVPLDRTKFTETVVIGKAGNGGAFMAFTVGDGVLKIE
jgi:hypothetical protein